jgi:Phytanoyl-CoA dioxygenase (PhyH)
MRKSAEEMPTLSWAESTRGREYSVIPNVFPQKDMDKIFEEFNAAQLTRSRAGVRHAMRIPAVAEMARGTALLGIAREILGEGAFPFRATLFDKSATANWLVVWHQDTALPLKERREIAGWGPWSLKDGVQYAHAPASALEAVVALRVHLDDSTNENGPLRVLPGTHALGVLTDDQIHDLSRKVAEAECLVPRGGVLAMRPLIVHASSKAQSEKPRRVLHIEYSVPSGLGDDLELAIA